MKVAKCLTKIIVLLGILFSTTISAFGNSNIMASLTIYAHINNDNGEVKNLNDVEFSMIKVADYENNEWVNCDEFKNVIDIPVDMNASLSNQKALYLYRFMKEQRIAFQNKQTTNMNGKLIFNDIDEGLYLIVQKDKVENDTDIYSSDPFLIAIPYQQESNYLYNMVVEPKIKRTNINKQEVVSANDQSNIYFMKILFFLSFLVIIVRYVNKRVQN